MSSSSPNRGQARQRSDIHSSSSALFLRSSLSTGSSAAGHVTTRRGDIHSDAFGSTPTRRRRLFVDENGMPAPDHDPRSEATFSNARPDTSEAEALGGDSTRVIWGTNISIQDSMSAFKNFLQNYAKKYRLWADGFTEEETRAMGDLADEREYITMLQNMRHLGVTGLNLDAKNLKAYPATLKLWHQLHAYPQEIIPLMDQAIKDVMVELAEKEMEKLRASQPSSQRAPARTRIGSSAPPLPSSDVEAGDVERPAVAELPDLVLEAEQRTYKVMPFGLDKTVNMRDLDPAGKFFDPSEQWRSNVA